MEPSYNTCLSDPEVLDMTCRLIAVDEKAVLQTHLLCTLMYSKMTSGWPKWPCQPQSSNGKVSTSPASKTTDDENLAKGSETLNYSEICLPKSFFFFLAHIFLFILPPHPNLHLLPPSNRIVLAGAEAADGDAAPEFWPTQWWSSAGGPKGPCAVRLWGCWR